MNENTNNATINLFSILSESAFIETKDADGVKSKKEVCYKTINVSFLLNNSAILNADKFAETFNNVSASIAYNDALYRLRKMQSKKERDIDAETLFIDCIDKFAEDYKNNISAFKNGVFVEILNNKLVRFISLLVWCMTNIKCMHPKAVDGIISALKDTNIQDKKAVTACKNNIILQVSSFYNETSDVMKKWNIRLKDADTINLIMLVKAYRVKIKSDGFIKDDKTKYADIKQALLQIFANSYGFIELKKSNKVQPIII